MNATRLFNHKVVNISLFILLVAMCAIYFWVESNSPAATPATNTHSSASPVAETKKQTEDEARRAKQVPITEEEKQIVAEKQKLKEVLASGDAIFEDFNEQEKQLYIKNLEANKAIAKLEAQVKMKEQMEAQVKGAVQ